MSDNDKKTVLTDTILPRFCESIMQVFETMVFMPIKCGEPTLKEDGTPTAGVSGTIGLTGENLCGSLSLAFPTELTKQVFRSMMMMGADDEVDMKELKDAVGELANMIAGGAKVKLQDDGIDFIIGLPTVVVGESHHLEAPGNATAYVVPVQPDKGIFYMELAIA